MKPDRRGRGYGGGVENMVGTYIISPLLKLINNGDWEA